MSSSQVSKVPQIQELDGYVIMIIADHPPTSGTLTDEELVCNSLKGFVMF